MRPHDHHPVIYVEWIDSGGITGGWTAIDEALEDADKYATNPIISAGLLITETDRLIAIAAAYNPNGDDITAGLMIPKSAIVYRRELMPARGMAPKEELDGKEAHA